MMTQDRARTPWWVWGLTVGLPCVPALVQVWAACWPPEGTVATGQSIGDSIVFTHCMRMFSSGYFLPYTSSLAEHTHHAAAYLVPLHALYGIAGAAGQVLRLPEAVTLNLINTLGGIAYLYAAYRLMVEANARIANLAFALFALGGGLGGWAFLGAHALGCDAGVSFEASFMRFARYELIEGARMAPSLAIPRLYYTLALAGCLGGLTAYIRWCKSGQRTMLITACGMLVVGSFINIRLGPPVLAVGLLFLLVRRPATAAGLVKQAAALAVPIGVGCAAAWSLYMLNPALVHETVSNIRSNMAFSAFLAATCFHWLVLPGQVIRAARTSNTLPRLVLCGASGYLLAFAVLYFGYQAYYGAWLHWVDFQASVTISDWALLGALGGLLFARATRARMAGDEARVGDHWAVLWFLMITVGALAAFGHGWYVQFTPDRLMPLLGVPLSMVTAAGIARLFERSPRLARALIAAVLLSGACSTFVAWAYFQGPLGYRGGGGPFAWTHAELMNAPDARLLAKIQPATLLAPTDLGPCMGDVATLRPGTKTVFGYGSFAFSDRPINEARAEADEFYAAQTAADRRLAIARKWAVRYVLCPDTHPVAEPTLAALKAAPWLREIAGEGQGVLFEVTAP